MIKNFTSNSITDLPKIATELIDFAKKEKIWLFYGEMGAGKTTFIKSLCGTLGVVGHVQSPTFSIVNEYVTQNGAVIYHFDCYRLKNIYEALDIGIEEYFDSGNLCLIEWPEKIEEILPLNYVKINISTLDDNKRNFEFEKI